MHTLYEDEPSKSFARACRGDKEELERLATMLAYGGACSDGARADELDPEQFREDGLVEFAAASRVAIAYGDLTGLQDLGLPPRGGES